MPLCVDVVKPLTTEISEQVHTSTRATAYQTRPRSSKRQTVRKEPRRQEVNRANTRWIRLSFLIIYIVLDFAFLCAAFIVKYLCDAQLLNKTDFV